MSDQDVKKNISRIRTFKSDSQNAKSLRAATKTVATDKVEAVETPVVVLPKKQEVITVAEHPFLSYKKATTVTAPAEKSFKALSATDTLDQAPQYKTISEDIAHVAKTQKYSILSDTGSEYDVDSEIAGGVIIRDTKRKQFKLIPAMFEATQLWYKEMKEKRALAKIPKHVVAKAESRIEVIEKAASGSLHVPAKDVSFVKDHLKSVTRTPISTAINIKAKAEIPTPTWAHIGDVDLIKKAQIDQEAALAQLEKVTAPITATYKISPTQEVTASVPIVEQKSQFQEPTLPLPTVQISTISPFTNSGRALHEELERNKFTRDVELIAEESSDSEQPEIKKIQSTYAPPREEKKPTSFYYALIGVILLSSLSGVFATYYFYTREPQSQQQGAAPIAVAPSLVKSQSSLSFELPSTTPLFISSVQNKIRESAGVVELKPKVTENQIERDATATEILTLLTLHAPGSFTRSIKEIQFGGTNGKTPFIIIKTTSFDAAFAGILTSEQTLISDFAPLFGSVVPNQPEFKDAIAANKNVRVLVGQNGTDTLVYTFSDQNTLVITTTRDVLLTLLPLVQ